MPDGCADTIAKTVVEEDGKWGVGPNGVLPVMSLRDTCTTNLALSLSPALSLALSLFLALSYHKRQLTLGKSFVVVVWMMTVFVVVFNQ